MKDVEARSSRVGSLIALPEILEKLQVSPGEIFRRAGIASQLFENPEHRVAHDDICRLLAICSSATARPDFGLLLGQTFTIDKFGTLGELMLRSATVREALKMLVLYLYHDDRAATPLLLRQKQDEVFLGYMLRRPATYGSLQLLDAAITVAYQTMLTLCGPRWYPRAVHLSHRGPENTRSYRQIFRCIPVFDARISGLLFSSAWLDHPLTTADAVQKGELERRLGLIKANASISFSEQVNCVLNRLLAVGTPSAAHVARYFACSERTLRVRLQREGTSLQQLLVDARFERACHLLRETRLPVSKIAAALCYADTAVFSRAFHCWSGMSPRQWRDTRGQVTEPAA